MQPRPRDVTRPREEVALLVDEPVPFEDLERHVLERGVVAEQRFATAALADDTARVLPLSATLVIRCSLRVEPDGAAAGRVTSPGNRPRSASATSARAGAGGRTG